jgi:hypothetical protein
MAQSSPLSRFRYTPLRDSTSEIRLLKLTELGGVVICRMITWPLRFAPDYYALSYTWGKAALSTEIVVNDEQMTVRRNCEYALRQIFKSKPNCLLWVDAICIDQESNQEKNHQVAMMGRIYAKATHVFASVGPHTEDSEFLLKTMDEHKSLLGSIHKHISKADHGHLNGWNIPNPIPRVRWLSLKCFFTMDGATRKSFAQAVTSFLKRPYFTRIWVLQELHLATTSSFCCGADTRCFDQLLAACLLVDFWVNQREHMSCWSWLTRKVLSLIALQSKVFCRQQSCIPLSEDFNTLQPQRGCLALTSGARGPRRLAEVLDEMQHFQCADLRDKLYGIMSLVEWGTRQRPYPDYAKDCFEVSVMVLELYLEDDMLAPVLGTYVDWTRRLHEVFEISPAVPSMRKALEARYPSTTILPETLGEPRNLTSAKVGTAFSARKAPRVNVPSPSSKNQTMGRGFRNMWYGVPLQQARTGTRNWLREDNKYLYLDQHWPTKAIMTGSGKMVALAPPDTRQGDWFVVSGSDFHPIKDSIGLVVTLVDPDTRKWRYKPNYGSVEARAYSIIGQAAFGDNHRYEEVFAQLYWESFSPRWNAEDLLVLSWVFHHHQTRRTSENRTTNQVEPLKCNLGVSSEFYGPLPASHIVRDKVEITSPYNYTRRCLDRDLRLHRLRKRINCGGNLYKYGSGRKFWTFVAMDHDELRREAEIEDKESHEA